MKQIDLVVFDMIGTTVEASPKIPQAFQAAFEDAGIALSARDIDAVRGKSKREAIKELLTSHGATTDLSDEVYGTFKSHLIECYRNGPVRAMPGSEETFRWLHDHGIRIALTTGFDREVAQLLIRKLGWDNIVNTIVCNDDVAKGRPAPDLIMAAMDRLNYVDVARVVSVGDTISDLEAGVNAGTGLNVGVLSGAHSREQLMLVPHTVLIDSVADLPALLS
jgi:phosphonatase-like hydrolase